MFFTIISTVILLAIAVLLIGVKVFFTKNGQFPNTHIGGSKALKEKGISCAKTQDSEERGKKNIFERLSKENTKN